MEHKGFILIVDDEQDVRDMLARSLERWGYHISGVVSGEDAISAVKRAKFDVVVLDIVLPGIDGLKTLKQLKSIDSELEVVMITAHGSIERVVESLRDGACDYVEKPLTLDKVAIAVRKALEKRKLKITVALYEISKTIFSTIEMDDLLKKIVELTKKVLRADDASVMLFDEKKQLYIAVSSGLDEEIKRQTRLSLGERIAGWVAKNKEPLILINGLKNYKQFNNLEKRDDIKSSLIIPLKKKNKVVGILTANRICINDNFTESDLYKGNIFISLVSLALDNANLYKKLKESQEQLVQSVKLAALGKLVAEMAHEVSSPLMVVSGKAQLSLMEDIKNNEIKGNLEVIVKECKRARGIMERLLQFSRPSKGKFKTVNINSVLDEVILLIEHQFELNGVSVKRRFGDNLLSVHVDEKQIQEVVLNLLNNAQEAIADDGTIEVSTYQEDGCIRVDIKDSGDGMNKDTIAKVCDPFFTTKEKGTGLGLSVCYGIIKNHNGELLFSSDLGCGTTVSILLPAKKKKKLS